MEITLRKCPVQGRYSGQADKLRVYVVYVAVKIKEPNSLFMGCAILWFA